MSRRNYKEDKNANKLTKAQEKVTGKGAVVKTLKKNVTFGVKRLGGSEVDIRDEQ